jgi:hypothetical protein
MLFYYGVYSTSFYAAENIRLGLFKYFDPNKAMKVGMVVPGAGQQATREKYNPGSKALKKKDLSRIDLLASISIYNYNCFCWTHFSCSKYLRQNLLPFLISVDEVLLVMVA